MTTRKRSLERPSAYFRQCHPEDFENGGPLQQTLNGTLVYDVRCYSCAQEILHSVDCSRCGYCGAYVHDFPDSVCRAFGNDHSSVEKWLSLLCEECCAGVG